MTQTLDTSVVRLSGHPLQRCGAWAVAKLAGYEDPHQVGRADLQRVAEKITTDAVHAAMAPKSGVGYDWWKVLFALYPNAKPTHAKRSKSPGELREEVAAMFTSGGTDSAGWPCTFCGVPSLELWAKSLLPMFDTDRAVNTLPPGLSGWPVCWACRVAMWALPYGAWVSPGSASVLTSDNPRVERAFVTRNVRRAERIRQAGFGPTDTGRGPEAAVVRSLRPDVAGGLSSATLWVFKNDNQDPWLRVSGTRVGIARFLEQMLTEADFRLGWRALQRALRRCDSAGNVAVDGATAAARVLFDPDLTPNDRLLRTLSDLTADPGTVARSTLLQWRKLAALYMEVMYDVESTDLKPVASMLAHWIQADSSRGRFNEYRTVADRRNMLPRLLMDASARLSLDSRRVWNLPVGVLQELTEGQRARQLRFLLWFEVLAELHRLGVSLGSPEDDDSKDEDPTGFDPLDEEEYA